MTKNKAIYALYPNVVTIRGDEAYDANDNLVNYDTSAIESEIAKKAYISQRMAEYPSFADQFDLLYHGGYDAWKAAIDAVKTKYPKGE
jgi:rhodanese-related sulfurtransferase